MRTSSRVVVVVLGLCGVIQARASGQLPFQYKVDVYRSADGNEMAFRVRLEQAFLAEEFEKSNFLRLRSDDTNAYLIYPQQTKFQKKHAEFFGRLRGKGNVKLRLSYDTVLENLDGTRRVEVKEGTIPIEIPEAKTGTEKQVIGSEKIFKDWANQQNEHFAKMLRYYPNESFFQYVLLQSGTRYGISSPTISQRAMSREETEESLYDVFTSSLAIQQSLQRQTLGGGRRVGDHNIPIASVQQPRLRSLDYKQLLKEKLEEKKEPNVHEVAKLIPHDQYMLQFNSMKALDETIDLSFQWGDSLLRLFTVRAQDNRVRKKFEQQLVVDHNGLKKLFADGIATEVALTGSDPAVLEGTDLSLIFRVTDPDKFLKELLSWYDSARSKDSTIVARQFNYRGHQVTAHYKTDRNVSSFLVQHEDFIVYSNSHRAIRKIIDATTQTEPNLYEALDYRYVTTILPPSEKENAGFFYASEAFIKRMVGPAAKISQKRRIQCFNNLIMQHNASLFYRLENGRSPNSLSELANGRYIDMRKMVCPHGGSYAMDTKNGTCTCSLHNRLKYLTPNAELEVRTISKSESDEYKRYRSRYEEFWQKVYDPIAVRITVDSSVKLESCILPMANSGIYEYLKSQVDEKPQALATSRIAPSAVSSLLMVPGRKNTAKLLRMIPGVSKVVENDPTLTGLDWIGDRVSIHLCDGESILQIDPTRLKTLDLPFLGKTSTDVQGMVGAVFMMANLPVYATVDVENREKAKRTLEQFAKRIFLQKGELVGFDTKLDAYQLPDYKDHDIYVLKVSLYAMSLRVHVSLVGNQLVFATKPHVLREVIDASQEKLNKKEGKAHMLIRLNHKALKRMSDDVQLFWAEKSRVACHRNVISIDNFRRIFGVPIDKIPELSEAKYGIRHYCPDHGKYEFNKELNQVVCSVHGNREHSHQHSRLDKNSSFSKFIDSLETITASLTFRDDALLATVEINRKK